MAEVNAAAQTAKATVAAKEALVEELRAILAEARWPWRQRLLGG